MKEALWIVLPTAGFAVFIGTALWASINSNRASRTSWGAVTALVGALLTIVLATHLLIG